MTANLPPWQEFSLKQQIGQMIVARTSGHLFDGQREYPQWEAPNDKLQYWLQELNLGGVILLGGSAVEVNWRSRQLQDYAKVPLFIAADIEEGVGQRFAGATWFPPPMALSAIASRQDAVALATKMGAITAQEATAIGINWLLAPVVDVNNNPHNPVINVRAFGDNPATVGELAAAFIKGAQSYPILTTAKHFPGHGDTATDSHLELPTLAHSSQRLQQIELPPFEEAIAIGVDSVMSAHLLVPAWDENYPATLSSAILTQQLRDRLGFSGLIVTDALIMGGITQNRDPAEICVQAVQAGADILLMPPDAEQAVNAIYRAVQQGIIERDRIAASVQRIWQYKAKIATTPPRDPATLLTQIATPTAQNTVTEITQASLQTHGKLPLKPVGDRAKLNLIVVDNLLNCDFLSNSAPAVAIPRQFSYKTQLIEQQALASLNPNQIGILQVFSRGNPFRGNTQLAPEIQEWFKNLLRFASLEALAIYGSPYILHWFRPYLPPDLPWGFTYGQMPSAQTLMSQSLFVVLPQTHHQNQVFT
ncbi:MAG: glycoside hydrolase family 3 N-terminal domain-containing protein [Jaaginema sp. PMC 1079.18]|nr:glycoside hydrolase family 3 N-terminal domain-containing protein [Jaaginema sp. PMC 1080.18]MEC4849371.1 glycoside hydrolase family 3 N-terminal domain-containing protein [Jaaginema sp. PMC 1079.18]MEC4865404.1 glycoside hydrolase family 3 N-terminal domain-containing protein [Jaaginema sp. PMC 1078.18]